MHGYFAGLAAFVLRLSCTTCFNDFLLGIKDMLAQ